MNLFYIYTTYGEHAVTTCSHNTMHNARIIQQGSRRHHKTLEHCNDGVSGTERVDEGTGDLLNLWNKIVVKKSLSQKTPTRPERW